MDTTNSQLLTLSEVLARLRISRTLAYKLIRQRKLLPLHIGRAIRFEPRSVEELIDKLAAEAQPPEPTPFETWRRAKRGRS